MSKHLIIGGVAGGATAAARIRRADENAEIILIERGPYISYANCGLPYYLGGVIKERDNLFVMTPQLFGQRFDIDVRIHTEATAIDTTRKEVSLRLKDGTEMVESYDKLLLSPGASPVRPPFEGIDLPGIFTLRNVQDTDKIKAYMDSHIVQRAVIVGAGFIGLEMAENLRHVGAEVAVVEMANQVMAPVDYSMASLVHDELEQQGVKLALSQSVTGFRKRTDDLVVTLKSGQEIPADLVILSIGVRPETGLAQEAGLRIGEARGIWVDEYLQTSVPDVYAVGDAIEYPHPLTGKPWLNYLANPANRQGRIVADNMVMGNKTKYEGAIGTAIAKIFDVTVATTGLAAKRLKMLEIPYKTSTTHSGSNAGYYPGSTQLTIKLTYHPETGKLYGGQIVGFKGVDKRIDQLALLIKHGGTIYDLMEIEHAYAPPFSSAKDPIAIAGYTAANVLSGAMPTIYWRELRDLIQSEQKIQLVDIRTPDEMVMGALPGAINLPLDTLRDHLDEVAEDKPVVILCAIGLRGYLATRILLGAGKKVVNLVGGLKIYNAATRKLNTDFSDWNKTCDTFKPDLKVIEMSKEKLATSTEIGKIVKQVDACGLQCPGPILRVKNEMDVLVAGQQLEVVSTDSAFARDVDSWCQTTGNQLMSKSAAAGRYTVVLEKGKPVQASTDNAGLPQHKGKTMVMFSDDLDKALATFVLANGAAATGEKVSIFFTFWGLNTIKKVKKPKVKKDIFGKLFGMMMPSDSMKLNLSKMSMGGIGDHMMRHVMKIRGVDSLESLRQQALDNGVEFIACQMSMDMMGIAREELLDECTIGGVATYMSRAVKSDVNLFI
ncbi:MAG: FAD-dependent oxidoreductase [Bacteroidaceae bacterium]